MVFICAHCRKKKSEMERKGSVSEDVLFSFSQSSDVVTAVLSNGLCAHAINSDFLSMFENFFRQKLHCNLSKMTLLIPI